MQIITTSIINFLEETFSKKIDDILIKDLLTVESLSISGKSDENKKQIIAFQELKIFQNLKYLEISNTLITPSILNILAKISYLQKLMFRDCTFSTRITNQKLTNIRNIKIIHCKGFKPSLLEELNNLKRIYLARITLENIKSFSTLNLYSLDISTAKIENWQEIDKINTQNLIISHTQYQENKEIISKGNYKIIIMAEDGYYIEEWIN